MRVFIHTGYLSADNGAVAPLKQYFDLAKLFDIEAQPGEYYGQDILEVRNDQWSILKELLTEAKMLYRIEGQQDPWQNVQTDRVRELLNPGENRARATA